MILMSDDFERPSGPLVPPWDFINTQQSGGGEIFIGNATGYHLEVALNSLETREVCKQFLGSPIQTIIVGVLVKFVAPPNRPIYQDASCMFSRVMGELAGGMYTVHPNDHHPVLGIHLAQVGSAHVWKVRYWDGTKGASDNERRTDVIASPTFTVDVNKSYFVQTKTMINSSINPLEPNGEIHLWIDEIKTLELIGIHNSVYGLPVEVRAGGRYIVQDATTVITHIDNYLASDVLPYVLHVKSQVDTMPLEGIEVLHEGKKYYTPATIPVYEGEQLLSVEPYKED